MPLFLDRSRAGKYIKVNKWWLQLSKISRMNFGHDTQGRYLKISMNDGEEVIYRGSLDQEIMKKFETNRGV